MGNSQIYCALCGGPFLEPHVRKGEPADWLSHAVLWTTAHESTNGFERDLYEPNVSCFAQQLVGPVDEGQRHVISLDATYRWHNPFVVEESGEEIHALHIQNRRNTFFLPLHKRCEELVQKFMSSKEDAKDTFQIGPEEEVSSIKQLWQVLFCRMAGMGLGYARLLKHPNQYYGLCGVQDREWDPEDNEEICEMVEADFIDIPELTELILENVRPDPTAIRRDLVSLVTVEDPFLSPRWEDARDDYAESPTKKRKYKHTQDLFVDQLLNKREFPWLWDLDVKQVRNKQMEGAWDWESLVHKLSKVDIHDPEFTGLDLPLGLKNRRRVWRCLEEARAGDVERQRGPSRL